MAEVANENAGDAAKPADQNSSEKKQNVEEKILADEVKHDPDDYDENGNLDELAIRIKTTNGYKKY